MAAKAVLVKRRTLLKLAGCVVGAYGCGSNSAPLFPTAGSTNPAPATPPPTVARTSSQEIFAFDSQGNLYLVRPRTAEVVRLNGQGQPLWSAGRKGVGPGQLDTPVALAVDNLQRVWVLDRGLARLQRFDAQGVYQGDFADGLLNLPQDLVFHGGNLLVSDAGNQRVAVLDLDGLLVAEFGAAQLNFPRGLGVDSRSRIHVVDSGDSRVLVFSAAGMELARYGGPGAGSGNFLHARGLAIRAQDGLIAVADGVDGNLELFDQDLSSLGSLATPGLQPRDLTFSPVGQLFIHGDPL